MEPRAAATIVVVRQAPEGIEVLALRGGAASRLLPGFVVFPGGTVEAGDAELAERWFGSPRDAARACAVRELAEEAGLALTSPGIRPLVDGEDLLEAVSAAPPSAERIPEIARWVAPDFLPVRFDARFFAAEGGRDIDPRADRTEIDRAWWARPGEVLSAFHADRASLAWPTLKTLEALATCSSVGEALALRVEQVPPPSPATLVHRFGNLLGIRPRLHPGSLRCSSVTYPLDMLPRCALTSGRSRGFDARGTPETED